MHYQLSFSLEPGMSAESVAQFHHGGHHDGASGYMFGMAGGRDELIVLMKAALLAAVAGLPSMVRCSHAVVSFKPGIGGANMTVNKQKTEVITVVVRSIYMIDLLADAVINLNTRV
jgi:hypothetical protein